MNQEAGTAVRTRRARARGHALAPDRRRSRAGDRAWAHAAASGFRRGRESRRVFRVNRHTVRRALAELNERGLVRAERGSGTYVARGRLPYPIGARTRFSENVGSAGRDPGGRLIGHGNERATQDIARKLGLKVGDDVVRLEICAAATGSRSA